MDMLSFLLVAQLVTVTCGHPLVVSSGRSCAAFFVGLVPGQTVEGVPGAVWVHTRAGWAMQTPAATDPPPTPGDAPRELLWTPGAVYTRRADRLRVLVLATVRDYWQRPVTLAQTVSQDTPGVAFGAFLVLPRRSTGGPSCRHPRRRRPDPVSGDTRIDGHPETQHDAAMPTRAHPTPSSVRLRALGYVRVSTDQQAGEGVSLLAQAAKIRAMAEVQDATLVNVVEDGGASGKSLQRPGLARLLALVEGRAVDVVIVAKLDRLTRSVRDLAELLERFAKRQVALVSVAESLDTGTAAGRLVLNVMASVSQWEREAIGERTRDALQHKKPARAPRD